MCRTFFPVIASVQDSRPVSRAFRVNRIENLQKNASEYVPRVAFPSTLLVDSSAPPLRSCSAAVA